MVIDAGRKNRLRIFHVLVFSAWLIVIGAVALKPELLTRLGEIVGVEKWSDFLVYMSIIVLWLTVFSLIQYVLAQQQELTRFTTAQALREYFLMHHATLNISSTPGAKDNYMFLIRAYNEATVLGGVLDEIIQAWFSTIVICNDGSQDDTEQVVLDKSQQYTKKNIILLSHLINRGPGAANKTLFAFARRYMSEFGCEWAVSYDADGQMDITDMDNFMKTADTRLYDIVLGSRFIKGGQTTDIPLLRKLILQGGRVVTYVFNGLWLTDVSTGYRAYSKKALSHIRITSDRFSYQNDIIDSIRRSRLKFKEIPVHIKYTDYSLSKGQSNMSAVKILIRLIYSSLFQR